MEIGLGSTSRHPRKIISDLNFDSNRDVLEFGRKESGPSPFYEIAESKPRPSKNFKIQVWVFGPWRKT